MNFVGLAVVMTSKCNAECAHCFGSYGPRDSQHLPLEDIFTCIAQAAEIPVVGDEFAIAGGEVFLYFDKLLDIIRYASSKGFKPSITTNGFWAKNKAKASIMVGQLKAAGLVKFEISVDVFHQEFIPITSIKNLLHVAREHGIETIMLRCHTTREFKLHTALAQLDLEDLVNTVIVSAPVVHMGRAQARIPVQSIYRSTEVPRGACRGALILTITAKGDVFPCCAGSELCPPLRMGNIYTNSLREILQKSRANFLLETLVTVGPSAFLPIVSDGGLDHLLLPKYTNICDLCHYIFTQSELTTVVSDYIERKQIEILRRLLLKRGEENVHV